MLKKIGKIVLLVLIFAGGFAVGLTSKYYIDEWRAARNVALWMDSLDPYKNDTYGGATPEETFDMYLAALKKGDLELASKYFWAERQKRQLEFLQKMKNNNESQVYIDELNSVKKDSWKKNESNNDAVINYSGHREKSRTVDAFDTKWNIIEKKLPIGAFSSEMTLTKLNNIWKIYSL